MTTTAYTRPGYRTVTAGLNLSSPEEFIAWATKALGATPGLRVDGPEGRIMHAEVVIGDTIIAFDRAVREPPTSGAMFHVYVPDADAAFERAVEAGSTAKMQPTDMFWGERVSAVSDPFGNGWGLATYQREVSPEEMKAGAEAFAKQMANR